jgi:dTDP-4-amino-4,6-dideoxygalactose transaminase
MPVHLYGQACNMGTLLAVARRYNLWVVEDNAQAQGAAFLEQPTGSFGHLNATSFYPAKNLGALGDGGAITTNSADLANQVRTYRNYGSEKKYYNQVIGINSRLDELQAAVLRVKLPYLNQWTQERIRLAALYHQYLQNVPEVVLPGRATGASHVYHIYLIRTPRRAALQQYLQQQGVGTVMHYPVPPYRQEAYRHLGFLPGQFPVTEEIAATCLSLPLWPGLTEEKIHYICTSIQKFFHA